VLGGSGQIGGAVLQEAKQRGLPAVGTYRSLPRPGLLHWDGSIDSLADRLRTLNPLAVVYAAGLVNVDACEGHEEEADRWNAAVPFEISRLCRGLCRFVYFSTEYVFDGNAGPYAEDDPVNPLSAYARSKVRGEGRILFADPSALVVRTTVVYGPEAQGKNFVAQLRRRLGQGDRMRVPHDQVSSPTYNVDLAMRTLDLLEREARGVWHVAGPEVMDRFSFARLAAEAFGLDATLLEPVATRELRQPASRPLKAGLRIDKLQVTLGPGAMRGPREGLAAYAVSEAAIVR
jgi:dTDP-4-dehydrorhamnose reductase